MGRRLPPFECEIVELGPRGVGVGTAPDGRRVEIRGAPVGGRVGVTPTHYGKSTWTARRTSLVRPPVDHAVPKCAQFGLCGGCTLQELELGAQRRAKAALVARELRDAASGAILHPVRGTPAAYGYRNKVELSFGRRRYLAEAELGTGLPLDGRFLGFHAPGRFDRIVDAPRCELVSERMNATLAVVRGIALRPDAPPPYEPKTHTGFWRHLALREAQGDVLCVVYTTSDPDGTARPWIEQLAEALGSLVVGFEWRVTDAVADVARGDVVKRWGAERIVDRIGHRTFAISATSFFQTNTPGAEVLYATVADAFDRDGSRPGGVLFDLYCGVGSIGISIADRFDRVVGVEENGEAVVDARQNAARNAVVAEFVAARVEDVLPTVDGASVVVDPPRAGLHPRVAEQLARAPWRSLVYVACNPASLGRDAAIFHASGVHLTDVWPVDLFPQTGHVEAVGRFVRKTP